MLYILLLDFILTMEQIIHIINIDIYKSKK